MQGHLITDSHHPRVSALVSSNEPSHVGDHRFAHQQHAQHHGHYHSGGGSSSGLHHESRSSYAMLSQAMSQAVSHEFSGTGSGGSSTDGSCVADDFECLENIHDRLGMEAIKSLHQQLDDDDNGNIDLTESDDFLREELKYDSGYEKRHKTFHYNDDTQISVKELWEAWLRSEVHNWTVEQTTDWLAQSVQLPQYVELFLKHKVSGETLPRLAVNNMHYVSNILGIRDPIHKQKIALKAMDVVLFGPPRETGTRWKDYILVTLLLSAIIGCWYAYQQNKSAKIHLRRMAKDMEGLQKAENALSDMQKELERARLEQKNVATEKQDLERRLKEAPSLTSSSSDLELQQLKQEIEMLRSELSRAEVELVDHCWTPPPALQSWLQLTYELESKHTLKKRVMAEKQLQLAREACEKLKKKRTSLVGAFVSTHGKSIDDVDRSIVEARNSLGEVTQELQERLHRWKQIEAMLGFNIVNNNGLTYLESILYNRNGSAKALSRARATGSQDELDDESVQGISDNHGNRLYRDDSSASDDNDTQSVTFTIGGHDGQQQTPIMPPRYPSALLHQQTPLNSSTVTSPNQTSTSANYNFNNQNNSAGESICSLYMSADEVRSTQTMSQDRITPFPRTKKSPITSNQTGSRAPLPPPRRATSHQSFIFNSIIRSQSKDVEPMESSSPTLSPVSTQSSSQCSGSVDHQPNAGTTSATQPYQQSQSASNLSQKKLSMEDTCSTDSSSFDDEVKKRRRKLHFPFGKKSQKNKNV